MSEISDVELRLEALKIASGTSYAIWSTLEMTLVEYADEIYRFLKYGKENISEKGDK